MAPIISLLIVLTFSLIVTRVATVALTLTGLSEESARFQARSAYTGVGFTTSESEGVVNHPVRRRILMVLMLTGNAGIVTGMAALILGFVDTSGGTDAAKRLILLVVGILVLSLAARSQVLKRQLDRVIGWALQRWTQLDLRDYANLFKLSDGYAVTELAVDEGEWLTDRTLEQLSLTSEGVLVLGIQSVGGGYVGAPRGSSSIRAGDRLILYGRIQHLNELDDRRRGAQGDLAHAEAVQEQAQVLAQQEGQEPGTPTGSALDS